MALYSCLVFLTFLHHAHSFGDGAPFSTCYTQYPKHDHAGTQTTPSPYKFTFTPTSYTPGQDVQIEVEDPTGDKFMGIQIAARRTVGNKDIIVGQFVDFPTHKLKAFNCFDGFQNMLTHSNEKRVNKLTFKWRAPDKNVGKVVFVTTLLKSYKVFWYDIRSELAVNGAGTPEPPKYPALKTSSQITSIDFDGCGDSKGCLYYPRHCSGSDCIAAASYLYRSATKDFLFELYSNHDADYISIGFSHDEWMGNDVTVSCTGRSGDLSIQEGFNPGEFNERHLDMFRSSNVGEVKYMNGALQCRFALPEKIDVYQVHQNKTSADIKYTTWDLKEDYYLMMAWGETMSESSVIAHHHEYPAISLSKVSLSEKVISLSSSFHLLVQGHGAVMMVAWILITGIVTIVARYYREWLPRTRWFDTKVWFQIHRALAILVFTLTVIGVILIFANYGLEIHSHALNHAAVGLTVLVCVCLQIVAGMLRPGGDHNLRPYFNWGHWGLGHVTHILSIASIFLAFDIEYINSDLKRLGFIVLGVWVAVDVIWNIVFEVISRRRKHSVQTDDHEILCDVGQQMSEPLIDTVNLETEGENQFKMSTQEKESNGMCDVILLSLYVFSLVAMCIAALVAFLLY